jgi:hypothetical protein
MKFGQKPCNIWHESKELKNSFSRLNSQINRLLLLDNLWEKTTGSKAKFWQLYAVKGSTIFVQVRVMAARHELLLKEKIIIKELNKNFDKPWIRKISIV